MLFRILAALLVVGLVVRLLRPRPSFEVVVRPGAVPRIRGKVPPQFANDCARICSDLRLTRARIRGFGTGADTRLRFSRGIPRAHRQRFRNAWHVIAH